MYFYDTNDVLPSGTKEIFWDGPEVMEYANLYEVQGMMWAVQLHPMVFGMKFSPPLSTELTRCSVFPVSVPCLFNYLL